MLCDALWIRDVVVTSEMNRVTDTDIDRWSSDLKWVIGSPFLMITADSDQGEQAQCPEIAMRDFSAEGAGEYTEKYSGHRVGYYFESLIHYWLKHVRKLEILAQGFQIINEGRTLGELDFVFRDEMGRVIHWEVAAKFYLYCEDREVKGSHYIGPNAQDTFELKREKIFDKQLPLSERAFPEVSFRQAFVKGRIFYHPEAKELESLPLGMMPDHLRGIWIRHGELSWLQREERTEVAYHLIEKPYWLSPECFSVSGSSPFPFRKLIEHLAFHFSDSKRPVLISVLVQEGGLWQETDRVFVVADDWPEL